MLLAPLLFVPASHTPAVKVRLVVWRSYLIWQGALLALCSEWPTFTTVHTQHEEDLRCLFQVFFLRHYHKNCVVIDSNFGNKVYVFNLWWLLALCSEWPTFTTVHTQHEEDLRCFFQVFFLRHYHKNCVVIDSNFGNKVYVFNLWWLLALCSEWPTFTTVHTQHEEDLRCLFQVFFYATIIRIV